MSTPAVSVDDFALYLSNPAIEPERAQFILDKAQILCETVVSPLPVGAEVVVLDVAERAFANPTQVGNSPLGLYSEGVGPFSTDRPGISGGGLYLTANNKAVLRNLAGQSAGAFTVNLLAGYCPPTLPIWDVNSTDQELLIEE